MTKLNKMFALLMFCLVCVSASASPVTITFNTLPGQTAGGDYVGYTEATVTGTVLGNNFVNAFFDLLCDDINHTTVVPSGPFSYEASDFVNPLNPVASDVTNTRFTNVTKYEEAAILLWDYDGLSNTDQSSLAGDYNFALWKLFAPSTANYGTSASLLSDAQAQQLLGTSANVDAYKHIAIFTPTQSASSNQEFLGLIGNPVRKDGGTPTPEPQTCIFMATGFGLMFLSRRLKAFATR